jgi:post-segregation antitoxin (ccd killing protein)
MPKKTQLFNLNEQTIKQLKETAKAHEMTLSEIAEAGIINQIKKLNNLKK